jgi:putative FmdB family regulatory protein
MPFYEFECTQCQEKFEVFATIAQKEKGLAPRCPHCGSDQVQRILNTLVLISRGNKDKPVSSAGGSCCGGVQG